MFLPNEPNQEMWKYFGMNGLGKTRVGFVLQKRGKKREINGKKQLRELRKRLGAGVFCRPRPLGLSYVELGRNEAKRGQKTAPKSHVRRGEDSGEAGRLETEGG